MLIYCTGYSKYYWAMDGFTERLTISSVIVVYLPLSGQSAVMAKVASKTVEKRQ